MRRLLLSVLVWQLICTVNAVPADRTAPNIVLIVADDLGYGELGCYGGQGIPTPNLDKLAASGVRFTDGYVTAPFCAASRAGMLTGRYQTRFGFEFNPIGARNEDPLIGLPPGEETLGDRLRKVGYSTGLIGKWHLGGTAAYHPIRRGFDEFFGFLHEGHYYVPPPCVDHVTWLRKLALPDGTQGRWTSRDGNTIWSTHMGHREPDYDANNPLLRDSQPVSELDNLTTAFTREACDFIQRHQEQPFFLYLAYNAVHSPLQARRDYLKQCESIPDIQRRVFAAMLMHLDGSIGELQICLHDLNLTQQTVVIFLSDNGGPTKELTSSNLPLRGGKGELYEGGIRVPFFISGPGHVRAGITEHTPVTSLDIVPTVCALAKANAGASDGVNLLPLLTNGESLPDRTLYWRVGNRRALRRGEWKIVQGHGKSPKWHLYSLDGVPDESRDLSTEQPQTLKELTQQWDLWDQAQVDPLWQ